MKNSKKGGANNGKITVEEKTQKVVKKVPKKEE